MDWTLLITGAMASLASIIGSFLANHTARIRDNEKREAQLKEKWEAEAQERAENKAWRKEVNNKLDEHNNYGKKFGECVEQITDMRIQLAELKAMMKSKE